MPENGFKSTTSYLGLGTPQEAQQQVFGEYTKKDMGDYSNAAYTALMKAQEQAFTEQMYNYNNWYNSEEQQMKRRLAAGLNPYSDGVTSGNVSAPAAPSAPTFRPSAGLHAKEVANTNSALQNLLAAAKGSLELYSTMFGSVPYQQSMAGLNTARIGLSKAQEDRLSNMTPLELARLGLYNERFAGLTPFMLSQEEALSNWAQYWNLGKDNPSASSPRASYQSALEDRISTDIEKMRFLIEHLYPSQEQRNAALIALDKYRTALMEGQNGAILSIDTGNSTADSILKGLGFIVKDGITKMVPSFGIFRRF